MTESRVKLTVYSIKTRKCKVLDVCPRKLHQMQKLHPNLKGIFINNDINKFRFFFCGEILKSLNIYYTFINIYYTKQNLLWKSSNSII